MDKSVTELLLDACDTRQALFDLLVRANRVVATIGGVSEEVAWQEMMSCNASDVPSRCDG